MAQPFKAPTGIYQLRRKVPPALRVVLGHEYKRSLKTRDPSEAKVRFAEEWARSETAFALARAQAGGAEVLTPRDVQQLAARWFRAEIEKVEASGNFASWLFEGPTVTVEQGDSYDEHTPLISIREWLEHDPDFDFSGEIAAAIKKTLDQHGIPAPAEGAPTRALLVAAFREHLLQLSDLASRRFEGDWLKKPDVLAHEPLKVEAKRNASKTSAKKLIALFDEYARDKLLTDGDSRGVRKTIDSYRATVEQFIEICGDLPVPDIARETIRDYRVQLAQLPASGSGIRKLTTSQMISKANAENLPRISEATIRNKLRAISAVLSYGLRLGVVLENPVIAGGIAKAAAKAATNRNAVAKRQKDYTGEELRQIFSSPIYSDAGWSSPRANFGKAWYWLPLLMYYTGARREEVAQLAVRDVVKADDGAWHLSILAVGDDDNGRGVKTVGSRRLIPLHPDLLKLDFPDYVETVPKAGQLFPLLKTCPRGYYGTNFGKRWASYLRETVGLTSSASPAHGFRHTFKTLCRAAGIPEDVHDAITGHAGVASVARGYGVMPLTKMAEQIARLPSAPLGVLDSRKAN